MQTTGGVQKAMSLTQKMLDYGTDMVPRLVSVAAVVLVGVLVAYALRALVRWAVERFGIDALAERIGVARLLYRLGIQAGFTKVATGLAFWGVLLLTTHTAVSLSGLEGLNQAMTAFLGYMPNVLAAVVVFIAGMLGADFLSGMVRRVAEQRDDVESPKFLGAVSYYATVVLAATLAVEQLGLEIALVNALIQIVVAAGSFGLAVAFALGARETVRNLIARFYVGRLFRKGDRVQMGAFTGTVVGLSPTSVLLKDGAQEVLIPCHRLMNEAARLDRVDSHSTPTKDDSNDDPKQQDAMP